jgi:nitrogen fixation NifU-like protein
MSSQSLYKGHIIDHYKNPRNFKKLTDFNMTAKLENSSCGDELEIFLKVEDGIVKDIGFVGSGCAISIASISILTEKVLNKSLEEVGQITSDEMLDMIMMSKDSGRVKCALLGLECVRKALGKSA